MRCLLRSDEGLLVLTFQPGRLRGAVDVPGDKSISHRALIIGSASRDPIPITNLNPGRDVAATRRALLALGVQIEGRGRDEIVCGGTLNSPVGTLDCANSGSTARMMLGVCAGGALAAEFDGDASLRRRPMEPVAAQLRAFGARVETSDGRLPMRLIERAAIQTRHFILLAPSAQVKSALLFAGLFADVPVQIDGDRGSRDHTERLLSYLGADVEWNGRSVRLAGTKIAARPITVAGDFSSASFFITAAAITPGSAIEIRDVGVNPTRTGLLEALGAMGAAIELHNPRTLCGEPVADIRVEHRKLTGAAIDADVGLRAIDEIPLVAAAAAFAQGTTTVAGVGSLRGKESDRVSAIERLLGAVGIGVTSGRNQIAIKGGSPIPGSGVIETYDDHRTVMAAAALACAAGPLAVDSDASVGVSFPDFFDRLAGLREPG